MKLRIRTSLTLTREAEGAEPEKIRKKHRGARTAMQADTAVELEQQIVSITFHRANRGNPPRPKRERVLAATPQEVAVVGAPTKTHTKVINSLTTTTINT